MDKAKWIVRGASLAVVLCFFLPVMLVSCSGLEQAVSLASLAGNVGNKPILYILPVAFIVAAVLTVIKTVTRQEEMNFLWGQLASAVIGVLVTLVTLLSLSNQVSQGSLGIMSVKPSFGFFILLATFIVFGVGWKMQWDALGGSGKMDVSDIPEIGIPFTPSPQIYQPQPYRPPLQSHYLVVTKGDLPVQRISINTDTFIIGRSATSSLQLPDKSVSREHAHIRIAQGAVFIQDQNSTCGTFVNGEKVNAIRLNSRDEIQIGPYQFRLEN